jgi:alpha-methylacyl-CoA racemase
MPPLGLVGDTAAGSLFLTVGVLAALNHARNTGAGQVVDASILDGTLSLMSGIFAARNRGLFHNPHWHGMMITGDCPYTGIYETSDGRHIVICPLEERFYHEFLQVLNLDPAAVPDRNDIASWPALREVIAARVRLHTRDHWENAFAGTDACATPVLSLDEAQDHPVNSARDAFIGGQPAPSPRFSVTPSSPAPRSIACEELLQRWRADPDRSGKRPAAD